MAFTYLGLALILLVVEPGGGLSGNQAHGCRGGTGDLVGIGDGEQGTIARLAEG